MCPQSCKWHLGGALQGWETNCAWKQKAGLLEEPESSSKMREGRWIVTHQCYLSLSLISLFSSSKWTFAGGLLAVSALFNSSLFNCSPISLFFLSSRKD